MPSVSVFFSIRVSWSTAASGTKATSSPPRRLLADTVDEPTMTSIPSACRTWALRNRRMIADSGEGDSEEVNVSVLLVRRLEIMR